MRGNHKALAVALVLLVGGLISVSLWLRTTDPGASAPLEPLPMVTSDEDRESVAEASPALPEAREVLAAPAPEPQPEPQELQESVEDRPNEVAAADLDLDGLYQEFESQYAGQDLQALNRALMNIHTRENTLVSPIAWERFGQGNYRLEGPLPEKGWTVPDGSEYPRTERPTVVGFAFETREDGTRYAQFVEIHPYELPELAALRQEQAWLEARVAELKSAAK